MKPPNHSPETAAAVRAALRTAGAAELMRHALAFASALRAWLPETPASANVIAQAARLFDAANKAVREEPPTTDTETL